MILQGIEDEAHRNGYAVLVGDTQHDPKREARYVMMLLRQEADGLIFLGHRLPKPAAQLVRSLAPQYAPVVNGCEFSPRLGVPSVHIDNATAAADAMDHLYGLGHRRIGIVTGPLVSPLSRDRLAGATSRAQAERADRDLIVVQGDFSIEAGAAGAERLLDRREPPTAVFCFNDEMAMVEATLDAFKTVKRTGIAVSGGDRVGVPPLTLEPGEIAETVTVTAESPVIQTQSGERSYAVTSTQIENLPIARGNFTSLTSFSPGVVSGGASAGGTRLGGLGQNNIMMDGISAMDTGNNGQMLNMNVDSIGDVKILTQGYQAEYGRSSGLQITAVTKSGSNRFRGSAYDIQTNSDWDATSWVNEKNGDPKPKTSTKILGYTIGGPVGKPGGNNKLFFFYSHEYRPVTAAINNGNPIRIRVPTTLERAGDFSQTLDNTGALFNLIRDPNSTSPCTAANTAGCFQADGVIGRIPADRLYSSGLALLSRYPLPNVAQLAGANYNYEAPAPTTENLTQQPALRLDYQLSPNLRFTGKYSGQRARRLITPGTIEGFNDVQNPYPFITNYGVTVNYTWGSSTFLEGTYGFIRNQLAGGASIGNTLTGGILVNPSANLSALPGFLRRILFLSGLCCLSTWAPLLPLHAQQRDLRVVEAVKRCDDKAFTALLRARADVNAMQPDGATALAGRYISVNAAWRRRCSNPVRTPTPLMNMARRL